MRIFRGKYPPTYRKISIDATNATVATAYRTGHFNRNKLITNGSYALTAADEEVLRAAGILLSDAIEA